MKHKTLFPLLCLPVIGFAVFCHLCPDMALAGFIGLSVFHVLSGLFFYKKKDISAVVFLIFLEGLALKLFYIAYTPYNVRQHDTGYFSKGKRGHFRYIYYLLQNHRLPFFYQKPYIPICHPPLHYILSALFLSVIPGYENLQYMTLIWAFGCSVVSYFCLKLFIKKEAYLIFGALFCSFFPAFTFYSGSLNNDILSTFLSILSVFIFLKHIKQKKIRSLLWSSFFLGLSGMVKLQALPIYLGILLFYISSVLMKQMGLKKAFCELVLFSAICLPMILIWPVYVYIRWNGYSVFSAHAWLGMKSLKNAFKLWFSGWNPFVHINNSFLYQEGRSYIKKSLYVGEYSLFDRLGFIFEPWNEPYLGIKKHSYCIPEYNIWTGLLKTALFDSKVFFTCVSFVKTVGFYASVFLLKLACLLFFFRNIKKRCGHFILSINYCCGNGILFVLESL